METRAEVLQFIIDFGVLAIFTSFCRYVIMAGGRNVQNESDERGHLSSTELWEIGTDNFVAGPSLPSKNFNGANMVSVCYRVCCKKNYNL